MSRYLISDLHIGHNNIHKFRKGIADTAEEHWEMALEGLRAIPKRATIFLLGDIAFTKEHLEEISKLKCKNKILVLGNHDVYEGRGITTGDLCDVYEKVYSLHKYKGYWMSHAPIHPTELRGKLVLHGHTHFQLMLKDGIPDPRYISCCAEYTSYKPITWEYATSLEYHQECVKLWEHYKTEGLIKDADN